MAVVPSTSWGWPLLMTVSQSRCLCNRRIYREGTTVCSAAEKSVIRLSERQHKYGTDVIREEVEKHTASVKATSGSLRFPEDLSPRRVPGPARVSSW